jgi:hypothetical protein
MTGLLICLHLTEEVEMGQKPNMDVPATEPATDTWIGSSKTETTVEQADSKFRQYSKSKMFAELLEAVSEAAK